MSLTRSTGALIGTSESTGVSINNGSTAYVGGGSATSDVDMLGDNGSIGDVWLYAVFTSTAAGGSVDITINPHRVSGQGYVKPNPDFQLSIINGTQTIPLGKRPCPRYLGASALNNGGATVTNFSLLYELEKLS